MPQEDPYQKAWKDWVERDQERRLETTKRMDKKNRLSQSWELVRVCRELIREKYSSWRERRVTEEERALIMEIEQAKLKRLENCKERQERYRNPQEIESKEEALRKRLILAEIMENAWKRRAIQP